jgi:hypothetical protein
MPEAKTRKTNASVPAFLAGLDDEQQRTDSKAVIELMRQATGAPPKMWGPNIIGFGEQMQQYANGKELDWPVIAFSPRKGTLVLYITGLEKQASLLKRLGKHRTGKVCLYVKRLSDVDLGVLEELIEAGVRAPAPAPRKRSRA